MRGGSCAPRLLEVHLARGQLQEAVAATRVTLESIGPGLVRDTALRCGADLIDLEKHILTNVKDEAELRRVFYDAVHFTDHGSAVCSHYIADSIAKLLTAGQQEPTPEANGSPFRPADSSQE